MSDAGQGDAPVREGPLAAITRPLAIAGGLVMLAAAIMVVVSVALRWITSYSLAGDIELVQIATAIAVFSFLPLCQSRRGNIIVDTFTTRLPDAARNALDALWDAVYALMAAIIVWRLALGAWDSLRTNTVSMMLGLPIGWAIALCAAMGALLVVVALATAQRMLQGER
jgi:TRAP-type C4-dicarboxylate transport system permease small subunit